MVFALTAQFEIRLLSWTDREAVQVRAGLIPIGGDFCEHKNKVPCAWRLFVSSINADAEAKTAIIADKKVRQ
jgi:hypothetical protein